MLLNEFFDDSTSDTWESSVDFWDDSLIDDLNLFWAKDFFWIWEFIFFY